MTKMEKYRMLLISSTAELDRAMSRLIRTVNKIDAIRKRRKRYERELARWEDHRDRF